MRTILVMVGSVLLGMGGASRAGAQRIPPDKPEPGLTGLPLNRPGFVGTVRIANQLADPGTVVDVVIFRNGHDPIVCGHGIVTTAPGSTPGYVVPLDETPRCLNPDNKYFFYVNGVLAPEKSGLDLPRSKLTYVNLTVQSLAFKTSPEQNGVRLVWFYGRVRDKLGQVPPDNTPVTAELKGGGCKGQGKTEDFYWVPKAAGSKTVGLLGWYFIPVEITEQCVNKILEFGLYAGPKPKTNPGKPTTIKTPPYGVAYDVELVMPDTTKA